jgi:hypothetical protein
MHPNDLAEPLCTRVEIDVPQKAAHKKRSANIFDIKPHQAVVGVPQRLRPKIYVMREERRRLLAKKERDQIGIVDPERG